MMSNPSKIVYGKEVLVDSYILNGRSVLAIKNEGANNELWKARIVVQEYEDAMKQVLVHNNSASKQSSSKVIVKLATVFGFSLYFFRVSQQCLQSLEYPMRKV